MWRTKRTAGWAAAVGVIVGAMQACNDDAGSTGGGSDLCARYCDLPVEAGCPNADPARCRDACNQLLEDPSCRDELDALLECMIELSPDDYWCNDDGGIVLSDGRCPAELLALYQAGCAGSDVDAGIPPDAQLYTDASYEWGCQVASSTGGDLCVCALTVLPEDAAYLTDSCDSSFTCCHNLDFEGLGGSCTCTQVDGAECAPPSDDDYWVQVSTCPPP